ncbi:putative transposase [Trichonephila clavipes]|nr:putative transposase [Trichonephila clavipes]
MCFWTSHERFSSRRLAVVAEWYGYRIVACLVTSSSPVPLKTRRAIQRSAQDGLLTADHKRQRVEAAQEFRFSRNNRRGILDSIVTGDETWVTPHRKQRSNRSSGNTSSPRAKKFKQILSAGKIMASIFWDRKGVLLSEFMPRGTTINADRYSETLNKLRRAIQNKRRGMLTKKCVFTMTTPDRTPPIEPQPS